MGFPRKPRLPEPTRYNNPLGLDELDELLPEGRPVYAPQVAIVTGLSDEEDARRYMALRFNGDIWFCPNCETYCERSGDPDTQNNFYWCNYCGDSLRAVGTKPRKRKFDAR